jgi:hypothetical protein
MLDRLAKALFKINTGPPSKNPFGFADVRPALFGIVLRKGHELSLGRASRQTANPLSEFEDGEFDRVPQIDRVAFVGKH